MLIYASDLRKTLLDSFQEKSARASIPCYVGIDCDSVCASSILSTLMKEEGITFSLHAIRTTVELISSLNELFENEEITTVVLINCGGAIDLQAQLDIDIDKSVVNIIIIDSYRPHSLYNCLATNIQVVDDRSSEFLLRKALEGGLQSHLSAQDIDRLRELEQAEAEDNAEEDAEEDEDEDSSEDQEGAGLPQDVARRQERVQRRETRQAIRESRATRRREITALRTLLKSAHKITDTLPLLDADHLQQWRDQYLNEEGELNLEVSTSRAYHTFTAPASASALICFRAAAPGLGEGTTLDHLLWLAVVAVCGQHVEGRSDDDRLRQSLGLLAEWLNQDAAPIDLRSRSAHQNPQRIADVVPTELRGSGVRARLTYRDDEPRLFLLRHQSVEDAIKLSSQVASHVKSWTETGQAEISSLLSKMGLTTQESKTKWSSLTTTRTKFIEKWTSAASQGIISTPTVDCCLLSDPLGLGQMSSFDMVHLIEALLTSPSPEEAFRSAYELCQMSPRDLLRGLMPGESDWIPQKALELATLHRQKILRIAGSVLAVRSIRMTQVPFYMIEVPEQDIMVPKMLIQLVTFISECITAQGVDPLPLILQVPQGTNIMLVAHTPYASGAALEQNDDGRSILLKMQFSQLFREIQYQAEEESHQVLEFQTFNDTVVRVEAADLAAVLAELEKRGKELRKAAEELGF
eukprot:gnl/Dysnectes_brevis/699_a771_2284.p1 GENE.gnl/Dysnectes_brevis/699_a771_2284~~gnl/Dysnectes_brevis/699_a771_2284.p1  ORF type:complete len:693 (+),score=144.52 gnl/Dysnectes_brevis/699_a771_2284:34-2112(+)